MRKQQKKGKRSIKIRREIVPLDQLKLRSWEVNMTISEYVNFKAKLNRPGHRKTTHTPKRASEPIDVRKWRRE